MHTAKRAALLVFFALMVFFWAPRPTLAPPRCIDNDHDGYGQNCSKGPDCNDSDPSINPGATEVCDNKDNDCDGLVDDGLGSTTCGLGQCRHTVYNCVGGLPQTCNPLQGSSPEVCNGLDDDCNGRIDDPPGADNDGDGVTQPCDCNDNDASIHPGAADLCGDNIDQDCDGNVDNMVSTLGSTSCLSIDPVTPVVGAPVTIRIRAKDLGGVQQVTFQHESGPVQTFNCGSPAPSYCEQTTTVSQAYQGSTHLTTGLYEVSTSFPTTGKLVNSVSQEATFACGGEYCPPDPRLTTFASWMRGKVYRECVVGETMQFASDPLAEPIIKSALSLRPAGFASSMTADLYDYVATDTGATNKPMGPSTQPEGPADPCQQEINWPGFCPNNPPPADYLFLQQKLSETFGANITLNYHRVEINYANSIGAPTCTATVCRYPSRFAFFQNNPLPPHAFAHWAIQTLNGKAIGDMTGETVTTEVNYEPTTKGLLEIWSHEWGHGWGLSHSFYGNIPAVHPTSLDGIMDNTYLSYIFPGDPLSPEERYALEPVSPDHYVDDATFGETYSAGESRFTVRCGPVDPAIASGTHQVIAGDDVFDLQIRNNGTGTLGYVSLRAYDGDATGRLIEDRLLNLAGGASITYRFTIPLATPIGQINITRGKAYFVLDQDNVVPDAAGDLSSNNSLTVNLSPCTDADGDGYAQSCTHCYNALCPVTDCYDGSASVSPVAPEGPYGTPTCSDGIDNNCNGRIDLADPGCALTQTAVSETTASGTKFRDFTATTLVDSVYEVLTEGGTKHNLIHTWTINSVQPGTTHELLLKGYRPGNTEGDNFQFYYSTNGTKFTAIPNAIIQLSRDQLQPSAFPFGTSSLSGTVYIRVQDTVSGGTINDSVYVDYLAIRTNI